MSKASKWQALSLGDVTFESKARKGQDGSITQVYGVDRSAGLTPDAKYKSKDLSRYKLLYPKMFAYNPMRLNIGSIAYCSEADGPGLVSPDYVVFGCDESRADPKYFKYLIEGREWTRWTAAAGVGSVRVRIYYRELARMPLLLPSLSEQKTIAHILETLDDKIELNRQMNETLDMMARAIFADWYARSIDDIERPLVQELIDEGALQIGDGYRAKRVELDDDGLPFVRAKNIQNTGFDLDSAERLGSASLPKVGGKVCRPGDIAFTSKGTVGRMTQVTAKTPKFVYSPQVCFWRVMDGERLDNHVVFRWMQSTEFHRQVAAVKGQTDMAEYVSLQDQRRMRLSLPGIARQKEITSQLAVINERVAANSAASRTLSSIRDAILPKLLSGEVRTVG